MIYILVFILLLIPVVKYDLMAKSGGEGGWFFFNLVVLILLAGLRYRVGGDTLMYMSMYDEIPALSELKYFDFEEALYNPLWYVYNSLFKSIGDDFVYFQIGQAIIVNSVFFWFFRKYSPQYYFSAILLYYIGYYCYFNMEILREILCVCILMLMTPWLLAKRWIPYYVGCIVAINLHYSSAVMLGIPLLYYMFRKPSWKLQLIIIAGIKILLETKDILLGEAPVENTVSQIKDLINEYPEIIGIHDLMVHNYGPNKFFASFHAEVNGKEDIYYLHDVIDNAERRIKNAMGIDCTIHMDPIETDNENCQRLRSILEQTLKEISFCYPIHDFRTVVGATHTNLIFDVVVPFDVKMKEDEIKRMISNAVLEKHPDHYCVITIDRG